MSKQTSQLSVVTMIFRYHLKHPGIFYWIIGSAVAVATPETGAKQEMGTAVLG
ncbi:MAG: hypothetical protein H6964_04725 [Chromatiaceae bacterium]|nr:hypothetical protein [Gammaproteobacteria bacterium]MCP5446289.1 hypothetical protein [Chromatiaceae bacterium]